MSSMNSTSPVTNSESTGLAKNEIVLFESQDGEVVLPVALDAASDTVWLNRQQLSLLFDRDVKTIGKHLSNVFKEELDGSEDSVVAKFATTAADGKTYQVEYYNLDVVISVGYRVKSKRGVEFRRWATGVLHDYIIEGYAENRRRLAQLNEIVSVMSRVSDSLEASGILESIAAYTSALDLLDDYDHQRVRKPKGAESLYVLGYEECRGLIDAMRFAEESDLFGVEKDESFKSSLGAIYQSFGGRDLYPSVEEKAANLLYFVVKNHSFHDGNKRIAAALFVHFLHRNAALARGGARRIDNATLVALTIMIAESKPEEKEAMVALAMSFLVLGDGECDECIVTQGESEELGL